MWPWGKSRATDVPDDLRANFEELGEPVVAQIVGRPYTHAAGSTPGVPVWAGKEEARQHALSWLREKRSHEKRKVWIGWGIGWFLSLIVICIAVYNIFLTKQTNRPDLISTDARIFTYPQTSKPDLFITSLINLGRTAALRGTATLFTVSADGTRRTNFGYSEITTHGEDSTTLTPNVGGLARGSAAGSVVIAIDMTKFTELFLLCMKYYNNETNSSFRQKFIFQPSVKNSPHYIIPKDVIRLDELPSSKYPQITCKG